MTAQTSPGPSTPPGISGWPPPALDPAGPYAGAINLVSWVLFAMGAIVLVVVVVALERLGRTVTEVTHTVADLTTRGITLRCLADGLDTATATGRVVAKVLTDLAALDAEVRP